MKLAVIHGSPRKGCTYHATQLFLEEMRRHGEVETVDFFLPKDMPSFCRGCFTCMGKDESLCPDAGYMKPILDAMLEADALLLTTPVYVLSTPGSMKAFLDHTAVIFLAHRPRPEMFRKKAFVLSTTAGAGGRRARNVIATDAKFWGVNRVYQMGMALGAVSWKEIPEAKRGKIEARIRKKAAKFYRAVKRGPGIPRPLIVVMFHAMRMFQKGNTYNPVDREYWESHGWLGKERPY